MTHSTTNPVTHSTAKEAAERTHVYYALKVMVENITGFTLPDDVPPMGMQVNIAPPNPGAYAAHSHKAPAHLIYMGGERLYLLSPGTKERYFFDGLECDYSEQQKEADALRTEERLSLAKQAYGQAEIISPQTAPELAAMGLNVPELTGVLELHEELSPPSIGPGELRRANGRLLQAFYTRYMGYTDRGPEYPRIVAVRALDDHAPATPENLPFCWHIHRFVYSSPEVWACGYANAVKALKRFPDLTVIEVYSVPQLAGEFAPAIRNAGQFKNFNSYWTHQPQKDTFLALTPAQIREFNTLLECDGVVNDGFANAPFCFIPLEG